MRVVALFSVLLGGASAANLKTKFVREDKYITTALTFDTQLRICNAYPFAKDGVQVFDEAIAYGQCTEVHRPVKQHEQIDFFTMQKQVLVGSFEVQEVPQQNTMMMLVIQPHDRESTGVSFQSHAFANVEDPQVALLDSFVGDKKTSLIDISDDNDASRNEKLKLNSVVAVHPGSYEIGLSKKTAQFVSASAQDKISVIRVGVAGSKDLPESLIVYPSNNGGFFASLMHMIR